MQRSSSGLVSGVVICLMLSSAVVLCAPFAEQVSFTQPDGSAITLWGEGDEFSAVFETLDGYTVVFDQAQQAYCFARLSGNGELESTGVQVHQASPAGLGAGKHLRMGAAARWKLIQQRRQRWEQGMEVEARWKALKGGSAATVKDGKTLARGTKDSAAKAPPSSPTTGAKVGMTLLIDFVDDPASIPQADIVGYCNGDSYTGYSNNGSVKRYFSDISGGALTYTNVVTAYVRMPQPKTYYNDTSKDCGTQGNLLIRDALNTLKALPNYSSEILPTLSSLTVDASNRAVALNVFYAGGNGGVWSYGLWPHSWALYNVGAQPLGNGISVFRYQLTNLGSSLALGTFCHENGHMLCGFPDLYDYGYDSYGGAGRFCLMGYNPSTTNPVQVCAYLKWKAGWGTVTQISSSSALLGSLSASAGADFNRFYLYRKPGITTEYYLLENRQRLARDAALPASGIAIWHIDELGNRDNQSLVYNTTHANYEVTLVQADNLWHFQTYTTSGDYRDLYYLGNGAAAYTNTFSDTSSPSARWWDGTASGLLLTEFSVSGATMTFAVGAGSNAAPVAVADSANALEDSAVTLAVLANDSDADGDTLTIHSVTQGAHGSVAVSGTSVRYTPVANWSGADVFTYTASDGHTASAPATVSVQVGAVNDAPTFLADPLVAPSATVSVGYAGSLAGRASDADGESLTFAKVAGPDWLAVSTDGTLSGVPAAADLGLHLWTVRVRDGQGASDEAILQIGVYGPDTTAPLLTVPPDAVITLDESPVPALTGQATASDDREPGPTVTYADAVDGDPAQPHTILRTWTATDAAGNSSSDTQTIVVIRSQRWQALGETTTQGTVSGSYQDTWTRDGVREALKEAAVGPASKRKSSLSHIWTFSVVPGDYVTLTLDAYHTANSEGDDFLFSYSTDGVTYTPMLTITATAAGGAVLTYELPPTTRGTVYVMAVDTDATLGNGVADTLYVDYLAIETQDWPPLPIPPAAASAPTPGEGAANVSATGPILSWTPGTQAVTSRVYFGASPDFGTPVAEQPASVASFALGALPYGQTFYWRVDQLNEYGLTPGTLWSFTVEPDPSTRATELHVQSIVLGTVPSGSKVKAQATVTVVDNLGKAVAGATVTGTFGGSFAESRSGVTDANGVAVLTTAGTRKPPVTVVFSVTSVVGPLPYDPADNVMTTASY